MPSQIDHYTCIKTLGSGVSAKVKLAQDPHGQLVALKIFAKNNPSNTEQSLKTLQDEVNAYKQLKHKNIVQLIDFKADATWHKSGGREERVAYMALEFVNGGELFDFVALASFKETICRAYFKQMLQAMHHAHNQGHAHRDLKPENIMLDKEFNIKIADFGFAAPMAGRDGSGYLHTRLGTIAYMAPELIMNEPYQGYQVDLFALGIILFILYAGHPPFTQAHPTDTHYKLLVTNRADLFWKYHTKSKGDGFFSENFKDLITNMLQYNPSQRLNLVDVIGHPWMMEACASEAEITEEFAQRQATIKATQEQEAIAKAASKQKTGVHRNVAAGGKVYMSGDDVEEEAQVIEETKEDMQFAHLKMDDFNEKTFLAKSTAIFSAHEPAVIFSQLQIALQKFNTEAKRDEKKWKMSFDVVKEQTDEEIKAQLPKESCKITCKLLRVNEQKVCIEFNRAFGNSWHFYDTVRLLKEQLEDDSSVTAL